MRCLSPVTRSRRGPESQNSFVARTLSSQDSKCRILSRLTGSIFDRDRIRFSCFQYASDEELRSISATKGFAQNGVLLRTRYRFDAKSQNTEKIETRPNLESFLVNAGAGLVGVNDQSRLAQTRAKGQSAGKDKVMLPFEILLDSSRIFCEAPLKFLLFQSAVFKTKCPDWISNVAAPVFENPPCRHRTDPKPP